MSEASDAVSGSFEETRKRQARLGLELTPVERLAWLEARREELARLRERMTGTPPGDDAAER